MEIRSQRARQFDPTVVDAFLAILPDLELGPDEAAGPLAERPDASAVAA